MIFSHIFALFLAQNFKTKVFTAQKSILLECLGWVSARKINWADKLSRHTNGSTIFLRKFNSKFVGRFLFEK